MNDDIVTQCSREGFVWPWQSPTRHFDNMLWYFDRAPDSERPCPIHAPSINYECEMHREGCFSVSLGEAFTRETEAAYGKTRGEMGLSTPPPAVDYPL